MKKLLTLSLMSIMLSVLTNSYAITVKTEKNVAITATDYKVTYNSATGYMATSIIPQNWTLTSGALVDNSSNTSTGGSCKWNKVYWDGTKSEKETSMVDKDIAIGISSTTKIKYVEILTAGKYFSTISLTGTRPQISWKTDTTVTLTISKPSVKIGSQNVTKAGTYTENLKSISGGDSTLTWIVTSTITAVNEVNTSNISIYPNPCFNELKISNVSDENIVTMFDLNGKMVLKQTIFSENDRVDVSNLKQGMYVVRVGNFTSKVYKR